MHAIFKLMRCSLSVICNQPSFHATALTKLTKLHLEKSNFGNPFSTIFISTCLITGSTRPAAPPAQKHDL